MKVTSEQVQRIKNLCVGWEEDFNIFLLGDLKPRVHEITCRYAWPCEADREDFVQETLGEFCSRATAGTLLALWDEIRDPVAFLTGRRLVYRIGDYLKGLARTEPLEDSQVEDTRPDPTRDGWVDPDTALRDLTLEVSAVAAAPAMAQYTGLQLFHRLKWTNEVVKTVREPLSLRVRTKCACGDPYGCLDEIHRRALSGWLETCNALREKISNSGKGVGPRERAELERRIQKTMLRMLFTPIANPVVVSTLGINSGYASPLRCRFIRMLPDLLPDLDLADAVKLLH